MERSDTDSSSSLDLATTAAGELVHGSRLSCGPLRFRVVDLTVADPSGARVRVRKRSTPAMVSHISPADRSVRGLRPLDLPLVLIGSSSGCDLVVPDVPAISAGIWLRGDGELELAMLDVSVLPYGQPVLGCRLLKHADVVELTSTDALLVDDPPERSTIEAVEATNAGLSPMSPEVGPPGARPPPSRAAFEQLLPSSESPRPPDTSSEREAGLVSKLLKKLGLAAFLLTAMGSSEEVAPEKKLSDPAFSHATNGRSL